MTEPPIDGVLGLVQTQTKEKYFKKQNQTATPLNQLTPSSKTTPSLIASAEVNTIQSTESPGEKKKGKNKSKKPDNQ